MFPAFNPADLLFAIGIVLGVGLCWIGYYCYRRWNEPGVRPFAAFAFLLGVGGIVAGAGTLLVCVTIDGTRLWTQLAFLALFLAAVPWGLFGLQYTGRYTRLDRRTVGLFLAPVAALIPLAGLQVFATIEVTLLGQLLGGAVFLYVLFLLGLGAFLVLQTTYAYGHLSIVQGVALAVAPIAHFLVVNTANTVPVDGSELTMGTLFVFGYGIPLGLLGTAVYRYDTFESAPAVGAIGERAIAEETDDLVFVVDREGRLIKLNETAAETLGIDRDAWLGAPLEELLDRSVDELRDTETISVRTIAGNRQYDPAVTSIADQHDRPLGWLLAFRDVTDREIRKQRLEVLNRVLRHNLRNRVSVIKGNAEVVAQEVADDEVGEHVETTIEAADGLASLGQKAKQIEELLEEDRPIREFDLRRFVEDTVTDGREQWPGAAIAVDEIDQAAVESDPTVLRFVVETLLENAIEHSDRDRPTVTISATIDRTADRSEEAYPLTIEIADDGPGIPDSEIEVIRKGTESPLEHGSGLGLWVVHWAVTDLGGELSFRDRDPRGSVVRIQVPLEDVAREGVEQGDDSQ